VGSTYSGSGVQAGAALPEALALVCALALGGALALILGVAEALAADAAWLGVPVALARLGSETVAVTGLVGAEVFTGAELVVNVESFGGLWLHAAAPNPAQASASAAHTPVRGGSHCTWARFESWVISEGFARCNVTLPSLPKVVCARHRRLDGASFQETCIV
jgi:hypothetical protein